MSNKKTKGTAARIATAIALVLTLAVTGEAARRPLVTNTLARIEVVR